MANKILRGHVRIDLCDPVTGKVKERAEGENLFTNALNSLYNGCPYGMDSRVTNPNNIVPAAQMPLYNTSLGGLILWPNSLGTGLNDYYPKLDTDYPTGYASIESYTVDDPKQGSFNAVESGPLSGGSVGYKYVYDFAPSQGNGQIATVSLSHKNCYKYFKDSTKAFITPANFVNGGGYRTVIGANSKGIYFNGGHDSYETFPSSPYIYRFSKKQKKLELLFDQTNINVERIFTSWQYDKFGYFYIDEDNLYYIKVTSSAATSVFELTTIDFATETVSTQSYTVAAYLRYSSNASYGDKFAMRGNYIYLPGNDSTKIYKINLTNVADVTELTLPTGANSYDSGCCKFGDLIIGLGFMIDEDDTVRSLALDSNNRSPLMCNRDGVWGVYTLSRSFGMSIESNYAATKFNLDNPLQKTATKSAKITYIVTQA